MIILDYVNSPSATSDDKIRTLRDSVQRAFNTLENQMQNARSGSTDVDLSDYLTKEAGDRRYAFKGEGGGGGGLQPSDVRSIVESYNYATQSAVSGKQDRITNSNKLDYSLIDNAPTIPVVSDVFIPTSSDAMSGKALDMLEDSMIEYVSESIQQNTSNMFDEIDRDYQKKNVTVYVHFLSSTNYVFRKGYASSSDVFPFADVKTLLADNDNIVRFYDTDEDMFILGDWMLGNTAIYVEGVTIPNPTDVYAQKFAFKSDGTYTITNNKLVFTTRKINNKALSSDIILTASDVGAYAKPSDGIPKSDFASDIQTSLGKADSALQEHQQLKTVNGESLVGEGDITIEGGGSGYEKPSGGIPKSDMSSDVQTSLGKADSALQSVGTLFKTATYTISSRSWNSGGTWLNTAAEMPSQITGYTLIGILGARATNTSNIMCNLNVNPTDKSIRGVVRNLASSKQTDGIYVYLLYIRDDAL